MPGSAAMQVTLSSILLAWYTRDTAKWCMVCTPGTFTALETFSFADLTQQKTAKCSVTLSENSAYVTQRLRCNQYSLEIIEGYFICTQGHRARDI